MGKKDKKKVSGAVKTAAKTEKKLEAKRKKELANIGEEYIETIVASIEREEAKRLGVIETVVDPPSPRVSATFTPHPINSSEIILFGGEHHDGKKTFVYNNMFIYNINKGEWRILKAPGGPPPRSAHQAVALSSNKGELWIFGGEFTSVTEMQFYHYKDLWLFNMAEKKWKKIESPGCPSSRSGHRMINIRRLLVVFGGYHDNGRNYKYYNDLYIFCTDNRIWKKIETVGIPPSPRSGCLIMPGGSNSIIIYGGYARVKDGKVDKGVTYGDLFRLNGVSNLSGGEEEAATTKTNMTFRWESLKGGVYRPQPPRSSFSCCVASGNKCYVFGGVADIEETEEELTGELFNTLHSLDLDNPTWRLVSMRTQKTIKNQSENEDVEMEEEVEKENPVTVCSDGVFTMTVGGGSSSNTQSFTNASNEVKNYEGPTPRMNGMIAVQKSILYLYGGLIEKGEKQFTLSDMYSLDLHKLDGWKTIVSQSKLPEWCGSDSENDDDESGSEESDESDDSD